MSVDVSLAGRLALEADGVLIDEDRFPGRQSRLVFAYLVAEERRPVPRDELAEALWGESPPATWEKALTVIVSKLRSLLGECGVDGAKALTSAFGCYRLDLPEGSRVDVITAGRDAEEAEDALAAGDLEAAEARAVRAAAVARRQFLPGEDGEWVEGKRRELTDVLSRALLCRCDVSLRSGDAAQAARLAEKAVALEPFRETGYRRLMRAHAAAGDRAEALRVYDRCRRLLSDELGAYPSPETESIYRGLLQGTPPDTHPVFVLEGEAGFESPAPLELPVPAGPAPPARRPAVPRARVLITAGVVLLAALLAGAAIGIARQDGAAPVFVPPNAVAVIDPETDGVVQAIQVGGSPGSIVAARGRVWVLNRNSLTVSVIDSRARAVVETFGIEEDFPSDLAAHRGGVWVVGAMSGEAGFYGSVGRTGFGVTERGYALGTRAGIAAGGDDVWVTSLRLGHLVRIQAKSYALAGVAGRIALEHEPAALAAGERHVWIANRDGTLSRFDPLTSEMRTIRIGEEAQAVAVGAGGVWVAAGQTLARVGLRPFAVEDRIRIAGAPDALAVGSGSVWLANARDGTVMRVDARTSRIVATIRVGERPERIAFEGGLVWVTVRER